MSKIVTKRRFIVAETAIAVWAIVEIVTQAFGSPGISMYGQLALTTIVISFFGGDAVKAKFRKIADQ